MRAKPLAFAAGLLLATAFASQTASRAQSGRGGQSPVYAQQPGAATPFSGQRAYEHVKRLVEFGPRPSGSKELEAARQYILEQLGGDPSAPNLHRRGVGRMSVREDVWLAETPAGKVRMVNIVCELPGETDDTILITGHYDTKRYKEFAFVGANDGGSSAGALIELVRAFKAMQGKTRFTYRFVFFDGEEAVCREWDECSKPGRPDNTYGSRYEVGRLKALNRLKNVRALILLDMMGYDKLELGRDDMSTPWLVDVLWKTARELGYAKQFVERAEGVGGDDHEPFLKAGVPSVDLIQLSTYPFWHTADDTLDKISPHSLKAVGDVVLASLPRVEEKVKGGAGF
ncbi:MAG: M28 family peptidase [Acidobacteria bacterium]|nr:M28 family peptidase [Acidobacteriota bacterium]